MPTILHVIDTCGPGGAETVFVELARRSGDAGHKVIPVITGEGWVADALRSRGLEPVFIPTAARFDWRFVAALYRLMPRNRVDLVHAHLFSTTFYTAIAALMARTPLVATLHGHTEIAGSDRLSPLRYALLRRGARRVVTVSDHLGELLVDKCGYPRSRLRTIHNGIELDRFGAGDGGQTRQSLGISEQAILVGAVGNFRKSKDYPNLLRAVAIARQRDPRIVAVVAGKPDKHLYQEALALRGELGLEEHVQFLGFQGDVAPLLQAIDIFALSSSDEGFSIVTIEAMASGVPVVVTRSGGPEEIVTPDEDGVMVPPRDPQALGEAMADLAQAPERRTMLGEAGRRSVQARFGIQAMVDAYLALYAEALA